MEGMTFESAAPFVVVILLVVWAICCALPKPMANGWFFMRVTGLLPTGILLFVAFNKLVAPYVTEVGPFLGGAIICALVIGAMVFLGIKAAQDRKS